MNTRELRKGETLDVLVAEHVMGQYIVRDADDTLDLNGLPGGFVIPRHIYYRIASELLKQNQVNVRKLSEHQIKYYSNDFSQATEVLERMALLGYDYQLTYNNQQYTCQFGNGPIAEAQTAPEAICIAALLVMGKENIE